MSKVDVIWNVTGAAGMLFTFALAPALLYFRVRKKSPKERRWLLWLPVSVLLTWLFLMAFRLAIEVPVNLAKARQEGDFMSDGVGGNAAVLFAGWIIPLICCLLFAGTFTVIGRMTSKHNQTSEPTIQSGHGSSITFGKMLRALKNWFKRVRFNRALLPEEEAILERVRSRFPEEAADRLVFVEEKEPLLPVRSSAVLSLQSGRFFAITNLAGFVKLGMTIEEVQRDFIDSEIPKKEPNQ